jgi:hypothetical protein
MIAQHISDPFNYCTLPIQRDGFYLKHRLYTASTMITVSGIGCHRALAKWALQFNLSPTTFTKKGILSVAGSAVGTFHGGLPVGSNRDKEVLLVLNGPFPVEFVVHQRNVENIMSL